MQPTDVFLGQLKTIGIVSEGYHGGVNAKDVLTDIKYEGFSYSVTVSKERGRFLVTFYYFGSVDPLPDDLEIVIKGVNHRLSEGLLLKAYGVWLESSQTFLPDAFTSITAEAIRSILECLHKVVVILVSSSELHQKIDRKTLKLIELAFPK